MNKENWPDSESLYERLKKYGKSDYYPFHMPGHKRKDMVFENPFDWDFQRPCLFAYDPAYEKTWSLKILLTGISRSSTVLTISIIRQVF